MKLNVKKFSQQDAVWKSVKLGTSTTATIGSDGCAITSLAMLCTYFGKDTDPQKLNTDLTRVKGFQNGALVVWGAISDIYPDIKVDWDNFIDCSTTDAPLDKIDALLVAKKPVIVKVDYDYHTAKVDQHWILVVGKTEDGAYICNDPIDGVEIFFNARYGDPKRYIFKIVTYDGPTPAYATPEDRIADLETTLNSRNTQIAELSLENNTLRTDLATQEKDNEDLAKQLAEARSEKDKIDWEKKQAQIKADELQKTIENLKKDTSTLQDEKKALRTHCSELQRASVEELDTLAIWKVLVNRIFGRR